MSDIKAKIRQELAGSSSQQPVDTVALYPLGTKKRIKAALMEMYQAREAACCKIIKHGEERIVWWLVGGVSAPHSCGRNAAA